MRRPLRLALLALTLSLYAAGLALTRSTPPLLLNTSASLPVGLYLRVRGPARVGDVVAACLPRKVGVLAVERGYVAPGRRCRGAYAPVLKRLAAAEGTRVAYRNHALEVGGRRMPSSALRQLDHTGRPLPVILLYPYVVPSGQLLLLNPHPDSFDGRYFGPVSASALLGVYRPLWTVGP